PHSSWKANHRSKRSRRRSKSNFRTDERSGEIETHLETLLNLFFAGNVVNLKIQSLRHGQIILLPSLLICAGYPIFAFFANVGRKAPSSSLINPCHSSAAQR